MIDVVLHARARRERQPGGRTAAGGQPRPRCRQTSCGWWRSMPAAPSSSASPRTSCPAELVTGVVPLADVASQGRRRPAAERLAVARRRRPLLPAHREAAGRRDGPGAAGGGAGPASRRRHPAWRRPVTWLRSWRQRARLDDADAATLPAAARLRPSWPSALPARWSRPPAAARSWLASTRSGWPGKRCSCWCSAPARRSRSTSLRLLTARGAGQLTRSGTIDVCLNCPR